MTGKLALVWADRVKLEYHGKIQTQDQSEFFCPGRVLPIFVYGDVRMEGKIQTPKHEFPENFAPKNIGILHISYPKIWVKIVF